MSKGRYVKVSFRNKFHYKLCLPLKILKGFMSFVNSSIFKFFDSTLILFHFSLSAFALRENDKSHFAHKDGKSTGEEFLK